MADGNEQSAQLESALTHEQQRLEKLWDAYEQQEQDLNASLDRINRLESDLETKQAMVQSLEELLGERDGRVRELEIDRQRQAKVEADYGPRVETLEETVADQTEKYDRLLSITQEMEEELEFAKQAVRARDAWFNLNVSSLEAIADVSKEWRSIQSGNFPAPASGGGPGGSKADFITEVSKLKGLGKVKAEQLYDSGFHSIGELKAASLDDISGVSGFTKLTAQKIVDGAKSL